MPAKHRLVPLILLVHRLAVIGFLEQVRIAPGVTEIVFGAGPDRGRELLAVDEELLIAFTPPAAAGIPDMQHDTAEPATALGLQHDPVGPSILRHLDRIAMPFAVKMAESFKRPVQRCVRDLERRRRGGCWSSLIKSDNGTLVEGHVTQRVETVRRSSRSITTCI